MGGPPAIPDAEALRRDSLLDPRVTFLNHGSFGACPRPVFEAFQAWQLELEREPVDLLLRRAGDLLETSRAALATYVASAAEDLVLVPNTTHGLNMVARALALGPGDHVLTTDQEYGAVDVLWRVVCERRGARVTRARLPVPLRSGAEVVDAFRAALDPTVRVVALPHITAYTGLVLPVTDVCRLAREAGALTVVDGAHAPSQLALDVPSTGADFYVGACHKWLGAPKTAGFLYTRPGVDVPVNPLIVSSGWDTGDLAERSHWQGTQNLSAPLTIPAAIDYQRERDWPAVRERCARDAAYLHERLLALPGVRPLSAGPEPLFRQLVSVLVPDSTDTNAQQRLLADHGIEVPIVDVHPGRLLRASVAAYNDRSELDALVDALGPLLSA